MVSGGVLLVMNIFSIACAFAFLGLLLITFYDVAHPMVAVACMVFVLSLGSD